MHRAHPSPQLLALALLLPALACAGEAPSAVEIDDPTDASSGTDAADASTGEDSEDDEDASESGDETEDIAEPECGDGIVQANEVCDDGELNGTPGRCTLDCRLPVPGCGDEIVQDGEACDDGNDVNGDGCNVDCRESGAVVWEHALPRGGIAYAVDVGVNGAIYVAGQADGLAEASAWAARVDHVDGSVTWEYERVTSVDASFSNGFSAALAHGNDGVLLGGQIDDHGGLVVLDGGGELVRQPLTPGVSFVDRVAVLPDGDFLINAGSQVSRMDGLVQEWETFVGRDLAHRPGDDVALAAVQDFGYDSAGFRRFTIHGSVFEPVTFPFPEGTGGWTTYVARTSDGDVIVAGEVHSSFGGAREALVLRSSSGGQLRWMYGPQELHGQYRGVYCLAVDSQDAIVVGGYTGLLGELRPFLMKLSADGEVLWTRSLELEATDAEVRGCAVTPADEVVAVGHADGHLWAAMLTP